MTVYRIELQLRQSTLLLHQDGADEATFLVCSSVATQVLFVNARFMMLEEDCWALSAAAATDDLKLGKLSRKRWLGVFE